MLLATVTLVIIGSAGYLIIKGSRTDVVLMMAGLILIGISVMTGGEQHTASFVREGLSADNPFLRLLFEVFSRKSVELVLVVMAVGGYARYMAHTGAADAVVQIASGSIRKLQSPYLALSLVYLFGQILNVFIPSAAGLAMLLLVALYPALVSLGVSPAGAAAVIGTTGCLDLGPLSSTSLVAASITDMPVMTYFLSYQIPAALPVMGTIALLHCLVQKYFDSHQDRDSATRVGHFQQAIIPEKVPALYALFPLMPLVFLTVSSSFLFFSYDLHVVESILLSWFIVLVVDIFRAKRVEIVFLAARQFLSGMWGMCKDVVTLIIAAKIFAAGIFATGTLDSAMALIWGMDEAATVIFAMGLVGFTGIVAFISGSGNAAFISFSELIPGICMATGIHTLFLALPMQFSSGMFRSLSPVAAVIIIVAGCAGVTSFDIVKRTFIPIFGGLCVLVVFSIIRQI